MPLFSAEEGDWALGDRGTIRVPGPRGPRSLPITFERSGAGYLLGRETRDSELGQANAPEVQFVPIDETPEDDFIAQVRITSGDRPGQAIFYVFVLRTERGGLRVFTDPRDVKDEFEPHPSDGLCRPNGRSNAECEFDSRANLIQYYLTYVRDQLIADCDPIECEATIVPEAP
jgi:hypothetical protein